MQPAVSALIDPPMRPGLTEAARPLHVRGVGLDDLELVGTTTLDSHCVDCWMEKCADVERMVCSLFT
jgi:hypothetical protein